MRSRTKQILSITLALTVFLSVFAVPAFANSTVENSHAGHSHNYSESYTENAASLQESGGILSEHTTASDFRNQTFGNFYVDDESNTLNYNGGLETFEGSGFGNIELQSQGITFTGNAKIWAGQSWWEKESNNTKTIELTSHSPTSYSDEGTPTSKASGLLVDANGNGYLAKTQIRAISSNNPFPDWTADIYRVNSNGGATKIASTTIARSTTSDNYVFTKEGDSISLEVTGVGGELLSIEDSTYQVDRPGMAGYHTGYSTRGGDPYISNFDDLGDLSGGSEYVGTHNIDEGDNANVDIAELSGSANISVETGNGSVINSRVVNSAGQYSLDISSANEYSSLETHITLINPNENTSFVLNSENISEVGDSDGDGIPDDVEGTGDADGDGTPNYLDLDSNGDGIPDNESHVDESEVADSENVTREIFTNTGDADGDGTMNFLDMDSDGDTIPNDIEGDTDHDGDGIPNFLDLDSDGDGIPDELEGYIDTDDDGTPNYLDEDSDGDGLSDSEEYTSGYGDSGGGSAYPPWLDNDVDDDGVYDGDETDDPLGDADGDGVPNAYDEDTDGDGTSDRKSGTGDGDGDGNPNYNDPTPGTCMEAPNEDWDNNGINNSKEGSADIDGDGIPSCEDEDNDGDGLDDPADGTGDFDGDGKPNMNDRDSDGDGILDLIEQGNELSRGVDADDDGQRNYLDTDSDNDGYSDRIEGYRIPGIMMDDWDRDGTINYYDTDFYNNSSTENNSLIDRDNDLIPDYLEADEHPSIGDDDTDTDGDGINDSEDPDSNGDGIPDSDSGLGEDNPFGPDYTPTGDLDGDGIPNYLDLDSDGDGINDSEEGICDCDNDGKPNFLDFDSDGDGINDSVAGTEDSNGNGVPDYLDENGNVDGFVPCGDSDDDGIINAKEGSNDTDGDGTPDYLDLDSDGDGINDSEEINKNTTLVPDCDVEPKDSDGDGVPDYKDTDSDGDGTPDSEEGSGGDTGGDEEDYPGGESPNQLCIANGLSDIPSVQWIPCYVGLGIGSTAYQWLVLSVLTAIPMARGLNSTPAGLLAMNGVIMLAVIEGRVGAGYFVLMFVSTITIISYSIEKEKIVMESSI